MTPPLVPFASELGCWADTSEGMPDYLSCGLSWLTRATGGEGMFGLLIGGTVLFALWYAGDGRIDLPATLTILFGTILIPTLPGSFAGIAETIIILGLAAGVFSIAKKYFMGPGV